MVKDDIWTTFPNVHLKVLDAENGAIEIQICDCGMSGHCQPQGWARIERHNRNRLADAIRLSDDERATCSRGAKIGETLGIVP